MNILNYLFTGDIFKTAIIIIIALVLLIVIGSMFKQVFAIVFVIVGISLILYISIFQGIINDGETQSYTWSGHDITVKATPGFNTLAWQSQTSDYEYSKVDVSTSQSLTLHSYFTGDTGGSLAGGTNYACIYFDDLNLAQYDQIDITGSICANTNTHTTNSGYSTYGIYINQIALTTETATAAASGNTITATKCQNDLKIIKSNNKYYLYNTANAQIGSSVSSAGSDFLQICAGGGFSLNHHGDATITISSITPKANQAINAYTSAVNQIWTSNDENKANAKTFFSGFSLTNWLNQIWTQIKNAIGA